MEPKILVIIPTSDSVEKETTQALKKQTYKNFDVMVSKRPPAINTGFIVFDTYFNCTDNMNHARQQALKTNAEYFLHLDSDIVLPKTALQELVLQRKDIIGGWYRIINDTRYVAGKWVSDHVSVNFDAVQRDVIRVHFVGHGCMLVSRAVEKKIMFRHGCDEMSFRDTGNGLVPQMLGACGVYGEDCRKAGFEMFMTGNVHCGHKNRKTGKIVK